MKYHSINVSASFSVFEVRDRYDHDSSGFDFVVRRFIWLGYDSAVGIFPGFWNDSRGE